MVARTRRRFPLAPTVVHSVCLVLLAVQQARSQNPPLEYQVKAAFLYNFAKFVDWPAQAFPLPNTPFNICLAGDPFQRAVERTVARETLNGRPIVVRRIAGGENVRNCHLIYVSPAEGAREIEIINAAKNLPILTIGELEDFINVGGMIRFVESGGRIRFAINPDATQRASLKVSSRLLRLADIVRPARAGVQ